MFSKGYKRYVLGGLTLVFTLNYVDRCLTGLLLQPIKEDLQLSDTQLGFLTGIAFALFYATLGLPVARWADRGNRVTITAIAIGLWGATVMACLFVTNFVQLVMARIAAAIGESGCMPPTYSLLGDYFPAPTERARAMAIYWLANPLAGVIAYIAGGALNAVYGWRVTFFLMGLPALLVAVLVKLTIAEPRVQANQSPVRERQLSRMVDVLRLLWHQQSARHLILAIILFFAMALGLAPWYAAFMIRIHGLGTAELGIWLGLIVGIGGTIGTVLGGYIAGRWFEGNEQGQMRLSATTIALLIPCFVAFLLLPQKRQALIALIPLIVMLNFFIGPSFALLQRLVADEMRATTLAVVMLLSNLIGMGIGPQLVGIFSDLLRPAVGEDSLRYAMLAMSLVALWSAYHFWRVGETVKEDLAAISARARANPTLAMVYEQRSESVSLK
jgi:predicted MFS family arabinose efflux permease